MPEKQPKPFDRLPSNVIPKNYALRLQPDLAKFTFEGSQEISVDVSEKNRRKKLSMLSQVKVKKNSSTVAVPKVQYTEHAQPHLWVKSTGCVH
jgi:hypothetical protein